MRLLPGSLSELVPLADHTQTFPTLMMEALTLGWRFCVVLS